MSKGAKVLQSNLVKRTVSMAFVGTAISVFVLLLITDADSTPVASRLKSTSTSVVAPAAWPTSTQVSASQPNSNGAMARANVHGTGVYVTKGVRQPTSLLWKFKITPNRVKTAPIIQGSLVYFADWDGRLYAVDAVNGTAKWNHTLKDRSASAPAVGGGTVYIGGWEQLYALSTDTGQVKWIFQPGSGSDDSNYMDPVVDDGSVYFGGWNYFYAVDSKTGQEKWKLKLSGVTRSVPVVYNGTIYVGTFRPDVRDEGYLYALDSKTGQEKWKLEATGGGIGGAVAVTNDVVYVGTRDKGLLALDATNGQEKWRYNPGTGIATAPAVAYDTVYITDEGTLYAVDIQTGSEKWKLQGDGSLYSNPIIADGIVYFTKTEVGGFGSIIGIEQLMSNLHAVDAQSGHELWKFRVPSTASRDPAVSNGTVYFGSDEGTLYAVK